MKKYVHCFRWCIMGAVKKRSVNSCPVYFAYFRLEASVCCFQHAQLSTFIRLWRARDEPWASCGLWNSPQNLPIVLQRPPGLHFIQTWICARPREPLNAPGIAPHYPQGNRIGAEMETCFSVTPYDAKIPSCEVAEILATMQQVRVDPVPFFIQSDRLFKLYICSVCIP